MRTYELVREELRINTPQDMNYRMFAKPLIQDTVLRPLLAELLTLRRQTKVKFSLFISDSNHGQGLRGTTCPECHTPGHAAYECPWVEHSTEDRECICISACVRQRDEPMVSRMIWADHKSRRGTENDGGPVKEVQRIVRALRTRCELLLATFEAQPSIKARGDPARPQSVWPVVEFAISKMLSYQSRINCAQFSELCKETLRGQESRLEWGTGWMETTCLG